MHHERREIRKTQLLEGEELWLILHERYGLLEEAPPEDDCLLLTNQRLIGFSRGDGRRRGVLLSLQDVDAVEVTELARSVRPLVTGGLLILAALAVVWLATAFNVGGFLPWLIGGILVLLGAITGSTYVVAEETAMITFRTGATEVSLPLRTPRALRDAHSMAQGFFQAKAGRESPSLASPLEASPWPGRGEPGQKADTPAPGSAFNPQESSRREFPRWTSDSPVPGMAPHHQESTQAERGKDV